MGLIEPRVRRFYLAQVRHYYLGPTRRPTITSFYVKSIRQSCQEFATKTTRSAGPPAAAKKDPIPTFHGCRGSKSLTLIAKMYAEEVAPCHCLRIGEFA
jgi:hypothetical protein